MTENVKVWEEDILLPTYGIGKAEKNPMFLEKRVYQGSSGVVYPYPVVEKIEDTCEEKSYHAVYLENEYIKVMILPELGGRVQMAYDKIKNRHFIYYNHVIKPALVGLTGPWISGGIEFNWPQHHRPSTFLPIDYTIERCADGSAIVWVSERERMFHQKGMAGFTLRPGRAVLEIQGKLYNPTPIPQTFLWWANPAVAVNDAYQSVFPADVNAVFDHGKRDVSRYPLLPVLTIRWIIRQEWIFPVIRISLFLPLIWQSVPTIILWEDMRMIPVPVCFTWQTIISRRVRSNGPGVMAISDRPGIVT